MMDAIDETEEQTRRIQDDIERTREDMDHTLTALEHRLAPEAIMHRTTESLRQGLLNVAERSLDAVKRHPAPLALAGLLVGARLALRPSAADRRLRQGEDDLERAMSVLSAGISRAKEQSQRIVRDTAIGEYGRPALRAAEWLGREGLEHAARWMERAREESHYATRALGAQAEARPLAAVAILALVAGLAIRGARAGRL